MTVGLIVAMVFAAARGAAGTAGGVLVGDGGAALTTYDMPGDDDLVKAVQSFGVNTAVSVCEPDCNGFLVCAVPPETDTVSMTKLPSLNCTKPAANGDTVAVSVTSTVVALAPKTAGEGGEGGSSVVDVVSCRCAVGGGCVPRACAANCLAAVVLAAVVLAAG